MPFTQAGSERQPPLRLCFEGEFDFLRDGSILGVQRKQFGDGPASLQKGAYVEVEGELRYREFTPAESDRSLRVAEIYASSILLLDRSDRQPASEAGDSESVEQPTN
jgi:hypothetical protein